MLFYEQMGGLVIDHNIHELIIQKAIVNDTQVKDSEIKSLNII